MNLRTAYFMLLVSSFTFFGLSMLQNLASFTDVFGNVEISFTLVMSNEEENESTTSNEVKEKGKEFLNTDYLSSAFFQKADLLKYFSHPFREIIYFSEVPTPPPEKSFI